jgi:peptide/nickel transport system permease protein
LISHRPIFDELKHRIPVSFELRLIALVVTWTVSFPLGVLAAVSQDRFPDYFLRTLAYALDALPSFVLGILLLTYLAVVYHWAPPVPFASIHVS